MRKTSFRVSRYAVLALLIVSTACASATTAPAPTPTSTAIPPTPTATLKPTSTPKPTATPNIAATQAFEESQARVKNYVEAGYLSTQKGKLFKLRDYQNEWAQMNYFSDAAATGYNSSAKDFVFRGDFQWESAVTNPETSGCGVYYRLQDNGDFYTAYLDTERVVMGGYDSSTGPYVTRFGITTGSGRVNIEKPAKANFTLIVNGHMAYVLVDDTFVGSYTLYTERLLDPGYLAYFTKSGTNKDYGTRCAVSNATLWIPEE